jgi:hypothetical protein
MKRMYVWAGLLAFVACPFAFSQQATPEPLPGSVLGPQLVAWSQMQKPQPAPAPLPGNQAQPELPQTQQQPVQQQALLSVETFAGTIAKDGNRYVLKGADNTAYPIDDQEKAKLYEGKQVRIAGNLDAKTNVLRVASIEELS